MITTEKPARGIWLDTNALLPLSFVMALCLATLTLWIPAYWPVALFEISTFLIAGVTLVLGKVPARATYLPLFALGFIVLWGCVQLVAGSTIGRFATERAMLQWMTWVAVYYIGVSTLKDESVAKLLRTSIVWFGFAVAIEAILQAYLSPGKVFGLFPTGYHDFVMGPIVYHTHFAALMETILPIALFLALRETGESYTFLGISAVLLTALVVSASRGGLLIGFAEVLGVLLLLHLQKGAVGRRVRFAAVALAAATGILTLIVGFETASARFSSEALAAGRIQFAVSTVHMIAAHPWIGWGLGCWPAAYPAFAIFDPGAIVNQAHSDWLQWTAEGGLPVGLAMLSLALWGIRPAIRSIWGIGVLAVLIHALFDYPFSRPAIGAWPILILSMAAVNQPTKNPPATDDLA
jgi:O-antigen ligase/polysaccharide polymerase Wzy-like membrane protein